MKKRETAVKKSSLKKSEETRQRILEAALGTFRERGFEKATMREVAAAAGVALGAAYYYFDSKDAIVLQFYAQAQNEIFPRLKEELQKQKTLEGRLRAIIESKFRYFAPNRKLLGALTAHTDPEHPLSPFSEQTSAIREQDTEFFAQAVADSKIKLPGSVQPFLPRLLWMYQMGLVLFWVYDKSPEQQRTEVLLEKTLKMLAVTLKIAALPVLRPLHRLAGELLAVVYGD